MFKPITRILWMSAILLLSLTPSVFAFDTDSDMAIKTKELIENAVQHFESNNEKDAIANFRKLDGPFQDGPLFVILLSQDGIMKSHRLDGMVGKDTSGMKDMKQVPLTERVIAQAQAKPAGSWFSYHWVSPKDHQLKEKVAYVIRSGTHILMAGFHPEDY